MSHTLQNIEDSESESRDGSGYLETMWEATHVLDLGLCHMIGG
jgi:hypothetical protein